MTNDDKIMNKYRIFTEITLQNKCRTSTVKTILLIQGWNKQRDIHIPGWEDFMS